MTESANSPPRSLRFAKAKLARAKKHIREADDALKLWTKQYPNGPLIENHPAALFKRVQAISALLAGPNCYVGDAIHNLRSALDHVAYALSLQHMPILSYTERTKVVFPIARDRKTFESKTYRASIKRRLGHGALTFLRQFKPYKGGNTLLWAIHHYDVVDKHRSLLKVGCYTYWENRPGVVSLTWKQLGAEVFEELRGRFSEGDDNPMRPVEITLGDIPALQHRPVIPLLRDMSSMVEEIIDAFKGRFFRA